MMTEHDPMDSIMHEMTVVVSPENGNRHVAQLDEQRRVAPDETVAMLRLLWESRRFLGRVTAIGLVISTAIAFLIPNQYQSVARLMPPDNQSNSALAVAAASLSGGLGGLAGMAGDLMGLRSSSDLLVGVLGSQTVEDRLIQRFNLKKVYGSRRIEDTRKRLENFTDITVDRKSQIITIKVTDKSPDRAAALAQAYVEELNRTIAEVGTSSARRERIFLEDRLRSVTQDLETAEKEFGQFASKNSAIDIKEQGKAMLEAAATFQGELIAARSELEGLRQFYADGNVRVRAAQARVTELENQLKKVGGENAAADPDKAMQGDALYPSIRQLPMLGVTYADLYRKTRVQEAVFETLTKQYELARVQEAKEVPTVKVLDPPKPPERKSFPPHTLLMLLGTTLAFWGGAAWVLGRMRWEHTDAADPGKMLAQEIFCSVKSALPWVSRNGHRHGASESA
jgi:uncharacterized protein involved in exopolysaccharide biosynthesis